MSLHSPKTENNPEAAKLEHADFARDMAAAEFGRHYPAQGTDDFQDRRPDELPSNWKDAGEVGARIVDRLASIIEAGDQDEAA